MTNDEGTAKRPQFSRRAALMKLGLAASAVYIAPAFTTLSTAQASGGSGGGGNSGGGNSGGSNSGPSNSGPSTSSPSDCESDSGCEDDS